METDTTCPTCTESGTLTCTRCRNVKYCSPQCQSADWPHHRLLCKDFATAQVQQAPGKSMRRVVLFPKEGRKVKFLWTDVVEEDYTGVPVPDMKELMDNHTVYREESDVNELTGKKLGYRLSICYDVSFVCHYRSFNLAVQSATNGFVGKFMGPVLAYCGKSAEDEDGGDIIGEVTNMDMSSYSQVVQYLIGVHQNGLLPAPQRGPKVEFVRIFCDGQSQTYGGVRFQAQKAPRVHSMFRKEGKVSEFFQVSSC